MLTGLSDPDDDLREELRLLRLEIEALRKALAHSARTGADWERRERFGYL